MGTPTNKRYSARMELCDIVIVPLGGVQGNLVRGLSIDACASRNPETSFLEGLKVTFDYVDLSYEMGQRSAFAISRRTHLRTANWVLG